jgi:hypothetical protein
MKRPWNETMKIAFWDVQTNQEADKITTLKELLTNPTGMRINDLALSIKLVMDAIDEMDKRADLRAEMDAEDRLHDENDFYGRSR